MSGAQLLAIRTQLRYVSPWEEDINDDPRAAKSGA